MNEIKNILYVEDEEVAFSVVRRFLEKLCMVENAVDAETAINLLAKKKYDLILMDISLKHSINGLDLTRLIRNMPDYIDIPIIAVTAHAMVGDKEKILDSGCDAYLSKPFTMKEIIQLIGEFLNK
ncbi:MAG TPA: response regulator [Ignavibacteriaceae bacterium]|jgi:two-component system, cell cycle response regulator DivK|nr:response regulator [Ignavibacteriaceae bacterium]